MGKSRRNRSKAAHRSDPIAKPVKPPTDPELVALRDAKVLPVLKDLQSSNPKNRTSAAKAIANIIQDAKCRKLLLREQVVQVVLTETLTDDRLESKAAGWFILKLLAQEEEADFCVHLYRQDVLTAIQFAAQRGTAVLVPASGPEKLSKAEQQLTWDIAGCLVALVSTLAEASEEILQAIDAVPAISQLLSALVKTKATPTEISDDALSTLLILSEDNLKLAESLVHEDSSVFQQLMNLKNEATGTGVLACGVLHNIFVSLDWHDNHMGSGSTSDAILVSTLSRVLEPSSSQSVDVVQLALEVLASIGTGLQQAMETGGKAGSKPGDETGNSAEAEWDGIKDDDDAMEEDEKSGSEDEAENNQDAEMDEEEMEADMEMVTGVDDEAYKSDGIDDLPTLKALVQSVVPQAIQLATRRIDSDDRLQIQGHALAVLGNIAWSVSCLDFTEGQNEGILKAWTPVATTIWTDVIAKTLASDTADIELATKVTSLAWAIARSLAGKVPDITDVPQKFISLYNASKSIPNKINSTKTGTVDDPLQSLGVKCIGVLGQLALDPAPVPVNREIGLFLVLVLKTLPTTPVADAVEALNQVFDVYGSEEQTCDKEVFWKDNFLTHLEEVLPKLRAAAKQIDKRSMSELRLRTDEAVLNLGRFIQYKKKHKPE